MNLKNKYQNISIKGHHGYFDLDNISDIENEIFSFEPDLILVGISSPKKERVILEKETKDLGNEIIAQYNALPPVLKKIIDESKVINDIAQQNVDAARDLTEEEQAAFDVKQDHSKIYEK